MPADTIYLTTPKGKEELYNPTPVLGPQLRKLLALIDGKNSIEALRTQLGVPDIQKLLGALERLQQGGYITLPQSPPPPAAKPPPRPGPVAASDLVTLDFTSYSAPPTIAPTPEQKAAAEEMTLAGMHTLKAAGYYVNILSKPGIKHPPRSGKKYGVLILDDDQNSSLKIGRTLMTRDFEVRCAETRDQALAELTKVPLPDAIVMNPELPGVKGLSLLERLQQHPHYASVPVIIITAELKHENVVDALARGASGYMTKPFKPEALLDSVCAVLGLK